MRTMEWKNNCLVMIDQRRLPWEEVWVELEDEHAVAAAIRDMTVRGAPAIGVAAAFGMALAARRIPATGRDEFLGQMEAAGRVLRGSRPTAVNLAWAVERVLRAVRAVVGPADALAEAALFAAQRMADEDVEINRHMALNGAALVRDGDTIIHHCNTGALAAVDWGTALGVVFMAHQQGKRVHVLLDETRPRLQGARLSAWELERAGISYEVIVDGASGYCMRTGKVNIALVGADRVAGNGDTANKIGTYNLALAAQDNGVPFFVVAPISTVDLSLKSGDEIEVEQRDGEEMHSSYGARLYPAHFKVRNPAFDVTPARLIAGIVTENGIARMPYRESLAGMVAKA
jgi:methylthioribose-1-phosphate isomerase